MKLPQQCIICRLMGTPHPPANIIRWEGSGAYQDLSIIFPACTTHANIAPDAEKVEKLINVVLGLDQ